MGWAVPADPGDLLCTFGPLAHPCPSGRSSLGSSTSSPTTSTSSLCRWHSSTVCSPRSGTRSPTSASWTPWPAPSDQTFWRNSGPRPDPQTLSLDPPPPWSAEAVGLPAMLRGGLACPRPSMPPRSSCSDLYRNGALPYFVVPERNVVCHSHAAPAAPRTGCSVRDAWGHILSSLLPGDGIFRNTAPVLFLCEHQSRPHLFGTDQCAGIQTCTRCVVGPTECSHGGRLLLRWVPGARLLQGTRLGIHTLFHAPLSGPFSAAFGPFTAVLGCSACLDVRAQRDHHPCLARAGGALDRPESHERR